MFVNSFPVISFSCTFQFEVKSQYHDCSTLTRFWTVNAKYWFYVIKINKMSTLVNNKGCKMFVK